ncbi:ribosomal L7Ae/L30e/S12e/Gadd45 family protein [Staphylococcus massiliensis]|uniref:Ribosomal protein L7Ae n=1 Tax=Staphylococcus massiliensis S46 TaxID=1229783 RepID=K9AY02_9STAP|nr:ribosomal L7Ae/L30e/S12e/Gadd45 family protein [Staphylococcus massiliensis]EKU47417.1 ribosomal protein L7Ae [Staphylococcus massiliensis S46]MCG3400335.1 ribosomal L7Ae/L30e/S12e/Gadd45 family protein [Staphylococcus massiliensis]MCG3401973.1 ribosomal L7Ae/L30e/S12e/Gadd45 family protein [Staphylococcus massiliensis]PNZ99113.1 50S ribosomal protein L7ae-like protein [Staphylococcus massiliensis CCUG 55927]
MSNEKVTRFNNKQHVVGLKETMKALERDQVTSLIIAKDVNVHLLSFVLSIAIQQNIPISYSESKQTLGNEAGINVSAIVVAFLK